MASKYNEQKIYEQLDKLTPKELYITFGKIKEFVKKRLEAEHEETEQIANDLASKIENL